MPASYPHYTLVIIFIFTLISNSLHTSFLRVIRHHGALQAGYRLPLKLTALQTPPVGPVALLLTICEFRRRSRSSNRNRNRRRSKFIIKSTTKLWRLCPWQLHRPYTKLTCFPLLSYSRRREGTISLPHQPETRSHTTCERLFVHSQAGRSTSCAFPCPTTTPTPSQPERNDKPTVCCYRRQWNPCHMDFGLVPASH